MDYLKDFISKLVRKYSTFFYILTTKGNYISLYLSIKYLNEDLLSKG